MSEFWKRLIFACPMVLMFLLIAHRGVITSIISILIIQAIMFHEISKVIQSERKERQLVFFRSILYYFLVVTTFSITVYHIRAQLEQSWPMQVADLLDFYPLAVFMLYVVGFMAFVLSLKAGLYRYQFIQFSGTVVTLLFITLQGSLIIPNMLRGMIWFLIPTSCVIINDTFAYLCGKAFGQTSLLKLSPKKTVEGFIGSAIFTVFWAWWFSSFLCNFPALICPTYDFTTSPACEPSAMYVKTPVKYPDLFPQQLQEIIFHRGESPDEFLYRPIQLHALALAIFASLVAPFGGFFASGFKRAFKLKDFGALIPGHGGMTDRMDCQFIMGVFTYLYYEYFVEYDRNYICGNLDMEKMLLCISHLKKEELLAMRYFIKGLLREKLN
mmetsp:Transcript_434/g.733  ORF Transcript_434/g.733 Transcript_434/m.733 type:complete len:384 (+) Transcript_434:39-1190(+)